MKINLRIYGRPEEVTTLLISTKNTNCSLNSQRYEIWPMKRLHYIGLNQREQ